MSLKDGMTGVSIATIDTDEGFVIENTTISTPVMLNLSLTEGSSVTEIT